MNKALFNIAGLFCSIGLCHAQQNLMLNYSFENPQCIDNVLYPGWSYNCDTTANQTLKYWNNPNFGTPDFYDTCGEYLNPGWTGYKNYVGFQYPRHGTQYVGIASDSGDIPGVSGWYEYIQGQMSKPLSRGKKYCVTYYVSLGDTCCLAISSMGAYLSDSAVCYMNYYDTLPLTPQVQNPATNLLDDKINWIPISGEYTASGGERYITLGNFYTVTPYVFVGATGGCYSSNTTAFVYYYVDDVYVQQLSIADAGRDTNICAGQMALLGEDSATPGVSYYWRPTTGLSEPNSPQTLASPSVTTTYTLTVVNDSTLGCRCPDSVNSSTVTVTVCDEPLYIPNAFSPNNDGQNDILLAKGNNIQSFYMAIYDRWGNKVFESNNITQGWDGTSKGQPENTGTYVYYIKGTYTDGTSFEKKGNITLVR